MSKVCNSIQNHPGIYRIIFRKTPRNKKFLVYVGESVTVRRRMKSHYNKLRKNKHGNCHLQAYWNKYGERCFVFELIEYCDFEQLREKQGYWMDVYNALGEGGFNILDDREEGKKINPIECYATIAVVSVDRSGKIEKYISVNEAARINDLQAGSISNCCNGKRESTGGRLWFFEKDFDGKFDKNLISTTDAKVKRIDGVGNEKIYNSAKDAAIDTPNVSLSQVWAVCNGSYNHAKGYRFEYQDDFLNGKAKAKRKEAKNNKEKQYKGVVRISKDGEIVKFKSLHEAHVNTEKSSLSAMCVTLQRKYGRRRGLHAGYLWFYEGQFDGTYEWPGKKKGNGLKRRVIKMTGKGDVYYDSITAAAEAHGFNTSAISQALNKGCRSAGCYWRFEN